MYTVALTPMTVGTAAAFADTGTLHFSTFLVLICCSIAIIAWLNLTNDVFDFDTGIDIHKEESIVNLCGASQAARNAILILANVFLLSAFLGLTALSITPIFDPTVLVVLGLAVTGGYMYQGPPFRLGYYGLGEPICFVTWILGVVASYYSQIRLHSSTESYLSLEYPSLPGRITYLLLNRLWSQDHYLCAAALLVAYPTAVILFCSHFHQLEEDKNAGKRSPVVRLGTSLASRVLSYLLLQFAALQLLLLALHMLPPYAFALSLMSAPFAFQLNTFVHRTHSVPAVVRAAKYYAVKFHFVHGMLLTIGFLLSASSGGSAD